MALRLTGAGQRKNRTNRHKHRRWNRRKKTVIEEEPRSRCLVTSPLPNHRGATTRLHPSSRFLRPRRARSLGGFCAACRLTFSSQWRLRADFTLRVELRPGPNEVAGQLAVGAASGTHRLGARDKSSRAMRPHRKVRRSPSLPTCPSAIALASGPASDVVFSSSELQAHHSGNTIMPAASVPASFRINTSPKLRHPRPRW